MREIRPLFRAAGRLRVNPDHWSLCPTNSMLLPLVPPPSAASRRSINHEAYSSNVKIGLLGLREACAGLDLSSSNPRLAAAKIERNYLTYCNYTIF